MKLSDFLEAVDYKVTETSKFLWDCFGDKAQTFSYWNGESSDSSIDISCTSDLVTQVVYMVEVWSPESNAVYIWGDPEYLESYIQEAKLRNVSPMFGDEETDSVLFSSENAILEVCKSEMSINTPDKPTVEIEIELPDDLLFDAMMLAHGEDITFNEYVNKVLTSFMEKHNA